MKLNPIIKNGLWTNNQALVALLGLCPLLAVSNNIINGLGLGIATLSTLLVSNSLVSLFRHQIPESVRIPVFVTLIAATVSIIDLLMQAYLPGLHHSLGIFIPLIVTNCMILARAEAFASKNPLKESIYDALGMGLGFAGVLVLLGAIREIVGQGTLFQGARNLLGQWADFMSIHLLPESYPGILLAILPPGAFIALGLIIALKNWYEARKKQPIEAFRRIEVHNHSL